MPVNRMPEYTVVYLHKTYYTAVRTNYHHTVTTWQNLCLPQQEYNSKLLKSELLMVYSHIIIKVPGVRLNSPLLDHNGLQVLRSWLVISVFAWIKKNTQRPRSSSLWEKIKEQEPVWLQLAELEIRMVVTGNRSSSKTGPMARVNCVRWGCRVGMTLRDMVKGFKRFKWITKQADSDYELVIC